MSKSLLPVISIVVPTYNEEEVVNLFIKKILQVLNNLNKTYEIIFVNDGSTDNTLNVLIDAKNIFQKKIRILNLSRNFGKEAAMTAGIENAVGEAVILIDIDLQHPPELIPVFIKKWEEGYDVVAGKRMNRPGESKLKRLSASLFYKINNSISEINIPEDVGDYRLLSRKVVNSISKMPENQRFMKGIFAWVGYKTIIVEYNQRNRSAGKSSFNGMKLWNFAIDGITSFSTVPLKILLYIGFITAFISFIIGSTILMKALVYGIDLPGYTSIAVIISFLGGAQLMGLGILGEYIGRIYKEVKRRPIFIIEDEY